jgi:hypothetical protein
VITSILLAAPIHQKALNFMDEPRCAIEPLAAPAAPAPAAVVAAVGAFGKLGGRLGALGALAKV